MSKLKDHSTTNRMAHDIEVKTFKCAAACTQNYGVSIDSSGEITNAATATLFRCIGVALETGAAGEVIRVQTEGFNNTLVTDGDAAATDLVLRVEDGGTFTGSTEVEMAADGAFAGHVIGKNLGADVSTAGICYIGWGPAGNGSDT